MVIPGLITCSNVKENQMLESTALDIMIPPGAVKPHKYREGVIQILLNRVCDKSCFGCTQGSNLAGPPNWITVENFTQAVISLKTYHGVAGIFGGNPALHPKFEELCEILAEHIPYRRRGIWCNNPMGKAKTMRRIFDPTVSNLNVHLDRACYDEFKRDWPECMPCGLENDSRHSPVHGAMMDLKTLPGGVENTEENRLDFIAHCDINHHWSGMFGQFRGELRFWFCEVAGAQSILNQNNPDYPDTGYTIDVNNGKPWQLIMKDYAPQVRHHCHRCLVPLKGYGELAMSAEGHETTTEQYKDVFRPKKSARSVEVIHTFEELSTGKLRSTVDYLGNARR